MWSPTIIAIVVLVALAILYLRSRMAGDGHVEGIVNAYVPAPVDGRTWTTNPMGRFNFYANEYQQPGYAEAGTVTRPASITDAGEWHKQLAQKCLDTYACVGFSSSGTLYGARYDPAYKGADAFKGMPLCTGSNCGTFWRKSLDGREPIQSYLRVRFLLKGGNSVWIPPGTYVRDDHLGPYIIKEIIERIDVPPGLYVNIYTRNDRGGTKARLGPGAHYPRNINGTNFSDNVDSLEVGMLYMGV